MASRFPIVRLLHERRILVSFELDEEEDFDDIRV